MPLSDKVPALDVILRTHEQISGYGLIKRRGRGGVAEVWEADSPAGYRVALKLVHLSTDLRSGELRALKITRNIRHPSLLEIFGTWQLENLLIICMELADRSLWDRFLEVSAEGLCGVPRSELLGYLSSVADAIDYLNDYKHSVAGRDGVGVQHRDLKPQNILLIGGRAKVADFGLARVMEQALASHTGPCTLPYAAPEYFGGKTSRQSDQYALAVTYCQLRSGWMPFHGSTAQITFGHLYNDPDLKSLPAPERPIVARALAKRPEERWPDCRSFIDALQALGSDPGGTVPDLLPRDQSDLDPEQPGRSGSAVLSALSLQSADSDFIPVDTCDLDPASLRSGSAAAGAGTAPRTSGSRLDRPRRPRARTTGGRPGTDPPGRLAVRMAALRQRLAHLGRQVAAATRLVGSAVACGVRSVAARLHGRATAATNAVRPRCTHLIRLVTAVAALGMHALARESRSLAARLHGRATALRDAPRPKWAHLIDRAAALTATGRHGLDRASRALAARLRLGLDRATRPWDTTGWRSRLRLEGPRIDRVATLAALVLAALACGAWSLTARARHDAPARGASAVRTVRRPALRVARADDATVDPTLRSSYEQIHAQDRREDSGDVESPAPPRAAPAPAPADGEAIAGEAAPATPAGPAEAVRPAPAPAPAPAPSATPPARAARSRTSPSEALALAGPVSMPAAPVNFPPMGPIASLASLRYPGAVAPPPAPLIPDSDRIQTEDKSTRGTPAGESGDHPAPPAPASPAAPKGTPPSLTLPASVSIVAGETTKLAVGLEHGDPSKPARLDFQGLPRGITVEDPVIPTGTATTEVVLSASARTAPGNARVVVAVAAGAERVEAATRLTVLPAPAALACERGRSDLNHGAYAQAVADFSEAIRLDPDSFEAHLHRGVAYFLERRYQEALADYTAAIRAVPGSADARLFRARVHRELGQYPLALEDYAEAIRLRPDARAYVARGSLQHEIGAYDRALSDYEAALRLRPDDSVAHHRRGLTRYVMGDNTGAIADFTEAIRRDPRNVAAYHDRSDAFARLGEYARAGADHDTFVRLSHPSDKGVLK